MINKTIGNTDNNYSLHHILNLLQYFLYSYTYSREFLHQDSFSYALFLWLTLISFGRINIILYICIHCIEGLLHY